MAAGIRLLQKMGWRQGKGIGTADTSASGVGTRGGSRWGRVAGVGVENTPLYALKPKDTLHGLGFDPFKVQPSSNDTAVVPAAYYFPLCQSPVIRTCCVAKEACSQEHAIGAQTPIPTQFPCLPLHLTSLLPSGKA